MTRDEALTIIAHKAATWPAAVMDHAGTTVWLEHLEPLRADLALSAMRRLERTVERPFGPVPAEFHTVYDAEVADHPALPRGEVCGYCDGNRWTLHHGGAIPCPHCNGMLHEDWQAGKLRPRHERREPLAQGQANPEGFAKLREVMKQVGRPSW